MGLFDPDVDDLLSEWGFGSKRKKVAQLRGEARRRHHHGAVQRSKKTHYHHLGPSGRLRNVEAMSKEKLQHLAAHPDSTEELRVMTSRELRRRGHHVPRIREAAYIEAWSPPEEPILEARSRAKHHHRLRMFHLRKAKRAKAAGNHELALRHLRAAAKHRYMEDSYGISDRMERDHAKTRERLVHRGYLREARKPPSSAERFRAAQEAQLHLAAAKKHRQAGRHLPAAREYANYRRKMDITRGGSGILHEASGIANPFKHHSALAATHMIHAERAKRVGNLALHAAHALKAAEHDRLARDAQRWTHAVEGMLISVGKPTYPDSPEWDFVDEDLAGELEVAEAELITALDPQGTNKELQEAARQHRRALRHWDPDEDVDVRALSTPKLMKGWRHHAGRAKNFHNLGKDYAKRAEGTEEAHAKRLFGNVSSSAETKARRHRRRAADIHTEFYARTGRGLEAVTGYGENLFEECNLGEAEMERILLEAEDALVEDDGADAARARKYRPHMGGIGSEAHEPIGKPGGPGAYHTGKQYPAGFQHLRNALVKAGHDVGEASAIAWSRLRAWAKGRGGVRKETTVKAQKVLAQLHALGTAAHGKRLAHAAAREAELERALAAGADVLAESLRAGRR